MVKMATFCREGPHPDLGASRLRRRETAIYGGKEADLMDLFFAQNKAQEQHLHLRGTKHGIDPRSGREGYHALRGNQGNGMIPRSRSGRRWSGQSVRADHSLSIQNLRSNVKGLSCTSLYARVRPCIHFTIFGEKGEIRYSLFVIGGWGKENFRSEQDFGSLKDFEYAARISGGVSRHRAAFRCPGAYGSA